MSINTSQYVRNWSARLVQSTSSTVKIPQTKQNGSVTMEIFGETNFLQWTFSGRYDDNDNECKLNLSLKYHD